MAVPKRALKSWSGDGFVHTFTHVDGNGSAYDLTGATIGFRVLDMEGGTSVLSISDADAEVDVTNLATGIVVVDIGEDHDELSALASGTYAYEFDVKLNGGKQNTFAAGPFQRKLEGAGESSSTDTATQVTVNSSGEVTTVAVEGAFLIPSSEKGRSTGVPDNDDLPFNLLWDNYNVTGDGSTNDRANVKSVIDAANTAERSVEAPPSTYRIDVTSGTPQLELPSTNHVALRGHGKERVVFKHGPEGGTFNCDTLKLPFGGEATIEDIHLEGPDAPWYLAGGNIAITRAIEAGTNGGTAADTDLTVKNVKIDEKYAHAIEHHACNGVTRVEHCELEVEAQGISTWAYDGSTQFNKRLVVRDVLLKNIGLSGGETGNPNGANPYGHGIYAHPNVELDIDGLRAEGTFTRTVIHTFSGSLPTDTTSTTTHRLRNLHIGSGATYGYRVSRVGYSEVSNSYFASTNGLDIAGNLLCENSVFDCSGSAVTLASLEKAADIKFKQCQFVSGILDLYAPQDISGTTIVFEDCDFGESAISELVKFGRSDGYTLKFVRCLFKGNTTNAMIFIDDRGHLVFDECTVEGTHTNAVIYLNLDSTNTTSSNTSVKARRSDFGASRSVRVVTDNIAATHTAISGNVLVEDCEVAAGSEPYALNSDTHATYLRVHNNRRRSPTTLAVSGSLISLQLSDDFKAVSGTSTVASLGIGGSAVQTNCPHEGVYHILFTEARTLNNTGNIRFKAGATSKSVSADEVVSFYHDPTQSSTSGGLWYEV